LECAVDSEGRSALDRLLDFSTPQAAGTDPNAFWGAFHQCPHGLKIRIENPLGLVIGVTDVMAALVSLSTHITCKCHGIAPPAGKSMIPRGGCYHTAKSRDKLTPDLGI